METARRFVIRTFGCQMNAHDSEKVANLLYHEGHRPAASLHEADLLVVNTCSIRSKAEHRLYSDLGALRAWKRQGSNRVLAVGGCVAQQEGDRILDRFEHVDFVFGTHNLRLVPALLAGASTGVRGAEVGESSSLDRFDLPQRHPEFAGDTPGRAFVTVMEGCDMFCSFCIVPRTRGREISRPAAQIEAEGRALAEAGVVEFTLLGQTVNAYGRHDQRRGRTLQAGTTGFGELLRRLAAIPGIQRIRYTSPHPRFYDDDLVRTHAELPELCPHVHLPLQSGADPVLERMRRRYSTAEYRALVRRLRQARPDLAISTDLIVGFPGETEQDFQGTLDLMQEIGFTDSYSFKYSPRPGTAATEMPDPVPSGEAQERLERLQAVQRQLTLHHHRQRVGSSTRVLIEGESRRGGQLQGRDPYHRIVNIAPPFSARVGQFATVRIVGATPHSLIGSAQDPEREVALKLGRQRADEPFRAQGGDLLGRAPR